MKESLVQQCIDLLKHQDIKSNLHSLFSPVLDCIIYEIRPYIYIMVGLILFIIFIFIMNLAILILLILVLRNKNTLDKIL